MGGRGRRNGRRGPDGDEQYVDVGKPKRTRGHAEWFWESGFNKHPIDELETTRDWNSMAAYSAWNAIKNHGLHAARDPDGHAKASLSWLAYIGGTRETQQILGDVILTGDDIEEKKVFPDPTGAVAHADRHLGACPGRKRFPIRRCRTV